MYPPSLAHIAKEPQQRRGLPLTPTASLFGSGLAHGQTTGTGTTGAMCQRADLCFTVPRRMPPAGCIGPRVLGQACCPPWLHVLPMDVVIAVILDEHGAEAVCALTIYYTGH